MYTVFHENFEIKLRKSTFYDNVFFSLIRLIKLITFRRVNDTSEVEAILIMSVFLSLNTLLICYFLFFLFSFSYSPSIGISIMAISFILFLINNFWSYEKGEKFIKLQKKLEDGSLKKLTLLVAAWIITTSILIYFYFFKLFF